MHVARLVAARPRSLLTMNGYAALDAKQGVLLLLQGRRETAERDEKGSSYNLLRNPLTLRAYLDV